MARRRPKGVLELGWACLESAASGRAEHVPIAACYPDTVVRRVSLEAGGGHGWRISALTTPRDKPAPWKIVVVTGAPSWAEYWAPVLAELPQDREMIVVDRPGFAGSEPVEYVGDIRVQAAALTPLLDAAPGQKVLLVGQSYGAAIASLMAAHAKPRALKGLVLLSGYFGESGPTAKWLVDWGSKLLAFIPRDLKNAVREVAGQPSQLEHLHAALDQVRAPIHIVHGTADDFAPLEAAHRLYERVAARKDRLARFVAVAEANHFLNDGPPEALLSLLEGCLPATPSLRQHFGKLSLWWQTRQDAVKDAFMSRAPLWRRGNAVSGYPERRLGRAPVAGVKAA